MKKFNRIFIVLVSALFSISCSNNKNESNSEMAEGRLTQNVINDIKSYYKSKFESDFNLQESETDTMSELNFTLKVDAGDVLGNYILVSIPKINTTGPEGSNSIVSGDLNGDHKNDIIICVSSEGENGSVVLPDPNKVFVFLNSSNGFKLATVTDADILNGGEPGFYYPVEIKDGALIGRSFLWGKDDSESNPTAIYTCSSRFTDNKLIFKNKKFVKNDKKAWE